MSWLSTNLNAFLALGVLLSALAAISAAFISYRAARKNSLAALRTAWIETLREELGLFLGYRVFFMAVGNTKLRDEKKFVEQTAAFVCCRQKILMMLNESEQDHAKLIEYMRVFEKCFEPTANFDIEAVHAAEANVVGGARVIFRTEWKRASKGE